MPTFRNVSPYGDLDIPLVGRVVARGEEFEVTKEQAEILMPQATCEEPIFAVVDDTPKRTPKEEAK